MICYERWYYSFVYCIFNFATIKSIQSIFHKFGTVKYLFGRLLYNSSPQLIIRTKNCILVFWTPHFVSFISLNINLTSRICVICVLKNYISGKHFNNFDIGGDRNWAEHSKLVVKVISWVSIVVIKKSGNQTPRSSEHIQINKSNQIF